MPNRRILSEDLIGGLRPLERLAVLVVRGHLREDRLSQLGNARVGAALQRLLGQHAKESFHLDGRNTHTSPSNAELPSIFKCWLHPLRPWEPFDRPAARIRAMMLPMVAQLNLTEE